MSLNFLEGNNPYFFYVFYIVSVRPSVRVVDHALTAVPIDFIFGMHIDVIPGSDIGTLDFSFLIIKDHLWTVFSWRARDPVTLDCHPFGDPVTLDCHPFAQFLASFATPGKNGKKI